MCSEEAARLRDMAKLKFDDLSADIKALIIEKVATNLWIGNM